MTHPEGVFGGTNGCGVAGLTSGVGEVITIFGTGPDWVENGT